MEQRMVWAIYLPVKGSINEWWCVCRAETPEGAADVVQYLLKSGDKDIALIQIKAEVRID